MKCVLLLTLALPPLYAPQVTRFEFKTEALCNQAKEAAFAKVDGVEGLILIGQCIPANRERK